MSGSREASVYWKPEWLESLRGHIAAGLSANDAAIEVNTEFGTAFTRSAAIGKASRAKIPLAKRKSGPKPKPKTAKPKRKATPAQRRGLGVRPTMSKTQQPKPFTPRPDPRPGLVPLLDLAADGCRWPSGEGSQMLFCNECQTEASSYCKTHKALSINLRGNFRGRDEVHIARLRKLNLPSTIQPIEDLS